AGVQVHKHGCLYESAPAYVTDQPFFLNSAIQARTTLAPHALLSLLKSIESTLGRNLNPLTAQRYGPRPLDLDLIFYGSRTIRPEETTPCAAAAAAAAAGGAAGGGAAAAPVVAPTPDAPPAASASAAAPPPAASASAAAPPPASAAAPPPASAAATSTPFDLEVPHPRLAERLFVLAPVADLLESVQVEAPGIKAPHDKAESEAPQQHAPVADLLGSAQAEDERVPAWVFHPAFGKAGVPG
ncbi:unnamed protein product, partial [Closterium sp. NIES-53]